MLKNVLPQSGKQTEAVPPGMLIFLVVWFGQIISLTGSGMTCFAQSISVYTDLGGSIANLGWLAVLAQLPGILLSPIAGVFADRFDRRWMMIICDTVAALATLVLRILIISDVYEIWHIYVIVVIISIANHFQWPAYFAAISSLVPKKNLGQANGLVAAGRAVGQIAAPFIAGVAVTMFKLEGVILFDLGTYLFATVILLFVRFPKPAPSPQTETQVSRGTLVQEAMYGLNYILSKRGLLGVILLASVGNFMLGGVGALLMPMALTITSIRGYGSMMSISGISLLLGGLVMGIWGGPKRRMLSLVSFMVIQGLVVMLGGLYPSMLVFVIAVSIFNFAASMVAVSYQVIWQTKVPQAAQGRVVAVGLMFTALALETGIMGTSIIADQIKKIFIENISLVNFLPQFFGTGDGRGLAFLIFTLGFLYILASIAIYIHPRIRFLERELPDMLPDEKPMPPGMVMQPAAVTIYEMNFDKRIHPDKK